MSAEAKLLKQGEADEERPLLPDAAVQKYAALATKAAGTPASKRSRSASSDFEQACEENESEDENARDVIDAMTYKSTWLKGWAVFVLHSHTVWEHTGVWNTLLKLYIIAFAVGFGCWMFLPDPELLDAQKFSDITTVINVFVSLMLSFFLSYVVGRWSNCIECYLGLANSIRNLALQLHALGVSDEHVAQLLRYGVLSMEFMTKGLERQFHCANPAQLAMSRVLMFDKYQESESTYSRLSQKERDLMESCADETLQVWVWVASRIGRMASDGEIPGMATPTYGRIMSLAQDAQDSIRGVRVAITVKVPFSYIHILAVLVHTTNILFAFTLGMSLGSSSKGIHNYMNFYYGPLPPNPTAIPPAPLTVQLQTIIVQMLRCSIGPLLYQAFLELGISISTPFGAQDNKIPTQRIIHALKRDLEDSAFVSDKTPHWSRPHFKQPK